MENQLSKEEIAIIKQAKAANAALSAMGMQPPTPTPTPTHIDMVGTNGLVEEKQFETYVDLKNLPSRGRFYNAQLQAQPLKVPDLLLIQGINDDNMTSRFTEIFGRRVNGVKPLDILLIDEYYISLWMRNATFPDYFFPHAGYQCPKCKLKVPTDRAEFGFEQIEIKTNIDELTEDFGDKPYIEKELPISKMIVKIHPKRRIHMARAEKIIEDEYTSKDLDVPDSIENLLTLISPIELGGISDLRKIFEFVRSDDFIPGDFIELLKMCAKYVITEDVVVNLECPNPECKEVTSITGYPFRNEIYFPIYTDRKSEKSKD